MVCGRSVGTEPAARTRPPVILRSPATQPASITSHWDLTRAAILPQAMETSTSATPALQVNPEPSLSAAQEIRRPHLLLALREQPWRMEVVLLLIAVVILGRSFVRSVSRTRFCQWSNREKRFS